jgi:DNA-binding GntR family transcriptional regulator
MGSIPEKLPAHETVYRALRDRILFGDFAPGQAITIHGLVDDLKVSMTPVREAIRRLTAEGALELKDNRRVSVPVVGPQKFAELAFARLSIEPKLAEIAAENTDADTIKALAAIDQTIDDAIQAGDVQAYMQANYRFHFTLYERANSQILTPIAQTLWLRYGPLSRIICGRYGTSNLEDQHEEALEALRAKNPEGVRQAIRVDIEQGISIVQASFDESAI